jgi:hypothetical protein
MDGLAEQLTGEQAISAEGYASSCAAQPAVLEKWQRWARIEKSEEPWPGMASRANRVINER